ncbi:hypothetical protein AV530_005707 [Patagioenas fasciata monilis]|uniref:Uncharacterized protein n=1 Tax=Patagioenas fasciata monilis TaxID=372326 RepID=A0A1V4JMC0_PATFA|nr:hypothetical protein AV530_005707 [Patagioenas fasciata monilis]
MAPAGPPSPPGLTPELSVGTPGWRNPQGQENGVVFPSERGKTSFRNLCLQGSRCEEPLCGRAAGWGRRARRGPVVPRQLCSW